MGEVEEHYQRLLAEHYTWMSCGDNYDAKVLENRQLFMSTGIARPRLGGRALDLGCGSGFQSLALAQLGFRVTAVDSSRELLRELSSRGGDARIVTLQGDIRDPGTYESHAPFEVVVCMGDTLVHLQSVEDVSRLFENVFENLEQGGSLVLSFRDLSFALQGADRAIPVRMDDERVMATFLEFAETHVHVHDMLFVKDAGTWVMLKSAYPKLRISADSVLGYLAATGFQDVRHTKDKGFSTIVARRP